MKKTARHQTTSIAIGAKPEFNKMLELLKHLKSIDEEYADLQSHAMKFGFISTEKKAHPKTTMKPKKKKRARD